MDESDRNVETQLGKQDWSHKGKEIDNGLR